MKLVDTDARWNTRPDADWQSVPVIRDGAYLIHGDFLTLLSSC